MVANIKTALLTFHVNSKSISNKDYRDCYTKTLKSSDFQLNKVHLYYIKEKGNVLLVGLSLY